MQRQWAGNLQPFSAASQASSLRSCGAQESGPGPSECGLLHGVQQDKSAAVSCLASHLGDAAHNRCGHAPSSQGLLQPGGVRSASHLQQQAQNVRTLLAQRRPVHIALRCSKQLQSAHVCLLPAHICNV